MARKVINPDELAERTYSHAIVDNGTLYMSGQVPRGADGRIEGDDLEAQTRKTFDNIGIVLEAAEKTLDDIAKVTCYIVGDQESVDGYTSVFKETFSEPYPCQTVVGTQPLGDPDLLVELEVEVSMD